MRSVPTMQNFPEEGHLELYCSTGFVTLIVWCYYVLHIDLVVCIRGVQICFGKGKPTITLQEASDLEDKAYSSMRKKDTSLYFPLHRPTESRLLSLSFVLNREDLFETCSICPFKITNTLTNLDTGSSINRWISETLFFARV